MACANENVIETDTAAASSRLFKQIQTMGQCIHKHSLAKAWEMLLPLHVHFCRMRLVVALRQFLEILRAPYLSTTTTHHLNFLHASVSWKTDRKLSDTKLSPGLAMACPWPGHAPQVAQPWLGHGQTWLAHGQALS